LEGFLSQRIEEKKTEKPNEMMLSSHGDTLSVETLDKYLRVTNQVLQMFNENKTKQLLLVRESKRFLLFAQVLSKSTFVLIKIVN